MDTMEPILRGTIYCAPRCGAKCTKTAYDRAVKEANDLADQMGDGWQPSVWENLGWHYTVSKGLATIYPGFEGDQVRGDWQVKDYCCHILLLTNFNATSNDPVEAYGLAAQLARTAISRMEADLDFIAN